MRDGLRCQRHPGQRAGAEIKRVVQVIEQYPETGKRVFQLVYSEFQRFLPSS
jgi:hypothetical protein